MDDETRRQLDAMFEKRAEDQRATQEWNRQERERRDRNAVSIEAAFDSVLRPVIEEIYLKNKRRLLSPSERRWTFSTDVQR